MESIEYNKVYDFTNENVNCLNNLYHFDNSKVLSVIGSGDQYFTSILNGAKKVDVFDINPTAYLYLILKFYAIRELTYEEFYDFLINKNFDNIFIYNKLESLLPLEVLKYYKYLMENSKKIIKRKKYKECFRDDTIHLLLKQNQKYYFNEKKPIIPFLIKENYYILKEKLKNTKIPIFFNNNIIKLNSDIKSHYDILLTSNIFEYLKMEVSEYTKYLKSLDIPEIQGCYDWFGTNLDLFILYGYNINVVTPSAKYEHSTRRNFVYSLKK